MDKNICNHTNKVKIGKKIYKDGKRQMYRCVDCYAFIKGDKIEDPKEIQPDPRQIHSNLSESVVKENLEIVPAKIGGV